MPQPQPSHPQAPISPCTTSITIEVDREVLSGLRAEAAKRETTTVRCDLLDVIVGDRLVAAILDR
jgi:hypothetical protein